MVVGYMQDVKTEILSNEKISGAYYKMILEAPLIAKEASPGQFVMVKCDKGTDPLLRRPSLVPFSNCPILKNYLLHLS